MNLFKHINFSFNGTILESIRFAIEPGSMKKDSFIAALIKFNEHYGVTDKTTINWISSGLTTTLPSGYFVIDHFIQEFIRQDILPRNDKASVIEFDSFVISPSMATGALQIEFRHGCSTAVTNLADFNKTKAYLFGTIPGFEVFIAVNEIDGNNGSVAVYNTTNAKAMVNAWDDVTKIIDMLSIKHSTTKPPLITSSVLAEKHTTLSKQPDDQQAEPTPLPGTESLMQDDPKLASVDSQERSVLVIPQPNAVFRFDTRGEEISQLAFQCLKQLTVEVVSGLASDATAKYLSSPLPIKFYEHNFKNAHFCATDPVVFNNLEAFTKKKLILVKTIFTKEEFEIDVTTVMFSVSSRNPNSMFLFCEEDGVKTIHHITLVCNDVVLTSAILNGIRHGIMDRKWIVSHSSNTKALN